MPAGSFEHPTDCLEQEAQPLAQRHGLMLDAWPTASFRLGVALQNAGAKATVVSDTASALDVLEKRRAVGHDIDFVIVRLPELLPEEAAADRLTVACVSAIRAMGFDGVVLAILDNEAVDQPRLEAAANAGCDLAIGDQTPPSVWMEHLANRLAAAEAQRQSQTNEAQDGTDWLDDPSPALSGLLAAQACPENRLLQRFVEKLPARLDSLQAAMRQSDLLLLETLLQQFKRSADAHGYMPLGASIRDIESRIRDEDRDLADIEHAVAQLMDLCQDASFAQGPHDEPPSVA